MRNITHDTVVKAKVYGRPMAPTPQATRLNSKVIEARTTMALGGLAQQHAQQKLPPKQQQFLLFTQLQPTARLAKSRRRSKIPAKIIPTPAPHSDPLHLLARASPEAVAVRTVVMVVITAKMR
jgi:hypothetical protein